MGIAGRSRMRRRRGCAHGKPGGRARSDEQQRQIRRSRFAAPGPAGVPGGARSLSGVMGRVGQAAWSSRFAASRPSAVARTRGRACGARAERMMASEARVSSSLTYRSARITRRGADVVRPGRDRCVAVMAVTSFTVRGNDPSQADRGETGMRLPWWPDEESPGRPLSPFGVPTRCRLTSGDHETQSSLTATFGANDATDGSVSGISQPPIRRPGKAEPRPAQSH